MTFQTWENPMGTDGFEFIEYAAPDPKALGDLFVTMGFTAIAKHRTKDVTLYRQGDVNFIINAEPDSFAQKFARKHGPSVCAFAFRVKDANAAYKRALDLGAWGFDNKTGPMELNIPAIKGIGDSLIYFVDRWHGKDGAEAGAIGNISIYDADFVALPGVPSNPVGNGLTYIDHLTHNVHRGRMKEWADFYETLFNFREIRYFDIAGKHTGLKSKAMTSPCGKIRIPINESSDDKSQIAEYLDLYHGEGVQHIAMGTDNVYKTVGDMKAAGVVFQDTMTRITIWLIVVCQVTVKTSKNCANCAFWWMVRAQKHHVNCYCKFSRRQSLARSSLKSFSVKAIKVLVKVTSVLCSNR